MKRIYFLSVIALLSICFSSCSNKNKLQELVLTPKSAEIKGAFAPYYEVVKSNYKLIKPKEGSLFTIKLEIKRTNKPFKFDYDVVDMGKRGFIKIYCDLFDETGVPVIIADGWGGSLLMNQSGASNMMDLGLGDTGWIEIDFGYIFKQEDILKAKSFSIRSEFDESTIKSFNSPSTSSSSTNSSEYESSVKQKTGNTNWDKLLSDYESYTDKYLKLLKKAKDGDASAITEYADMLGKAQELQESLSDANDDLTPAQLQKFTKIQQKLINAATDL